MSVVVAGDSRREFGGLLPKAAQACLKAAFGGNLPKNFYEIPATPVAQEFFGSTFFAKKVEKVQAKKIPL